MILDTETLRKVQLVQLEIAKEVRRICEKHNIQYFLDAGTLLGAVRHQGFIPWDDDLDIGMMREHYDRFIEIAAAELDEKYILQTWDTDEGYGFPFAKVRKKGTIYREQIAQDSSADCGIWIDIFPYDNQPDDRKQANHLKYMITLYRMIMKMKCHYKPWKNTRGTAAKQWLYYIPIRFIALFVSKEKLKQRYLRLVLEYNTQESKLVYEQEATKHGLWLIPSSCFREFTELPFEGESFWVPKDYDKYLSSIYGDYMTPPPVEKRISTHEIVQVEL